jgi:peptidyl-prolyl isomerase D
VFGAVLKGKSLVRMIEESKTDNRDCPVSPVTIADCGEILGGVDDGITVDPNDPYEDYPDLWDGDKSPESLLKIATHLKELGNEAFRTLRFLRAIEKYNQVMQLVSVSDPRR